MDGRSIIQEFFSDGIKTIKRFPFTVLIVAMITVSIMYGFQKEDWPPRILSLMITGTYGVFLAHAIHIARAPQ